MAFTSLQGRLASLPLVLAGPILRRVEPGIVSVWVALKEARTVELQVWPGPHGAGSPGGVIDNSSALRTASAPTVRIGKNLHIALVVADFSGAPLIPGSLYSYNIAFSDGTDLSTVGLLEDAEEATPKRLALGYLPLQLPSFVMPSVNLQDLVIAHASCRKAHGAGVDGLAGLDSFIKKNRLNGPRPHLLFLTGDQIYADDVALPLLPYLTDAANVLLSDREKLPIEGVLQTVNRANFPLGRRAKLVNETAKFTCGSDGRCHLLSFGEYCATYLFYWSNVLWPDFDDLPKCVEVPNLNEINKCSNDIRAELNIANPPDAINRFLDGPIHDNEGMRNAYRDELFSIKEFHKTLPEVCRVLANVPVLMQHDDHDVTDDWNLTQGWTNRVLTNALGTAVVRNALSAFAVFQGWGNQDYRNPAAHPFRNLINSISQLLPDAADGPPPAVADTLLDYFGLKGAAPQVAWNFSIKAGPTQVVVLDTRTHRAFLGQDDAPLLISAISLAAQLPPALVTSPGAEVTLIVSPAPVLGLPLIEHLFQPLLIRKQEIGQRFDGKKLRGFEEWDLEPWGANPEGLENLLARLHTLQKVIILSGDVHYGFSGGMNYWKPAIGGSGSVSRFAQLTSSACKNFITRKSVGKLLSTGIGQRLAFNVPEKTLKIRGWQDHADLVGHVNLPPGITLPPNLRYMSHRSPADLPEHGWPKGTDIANAIDILPDWVWHFEVAKDTRPDDNSANARPEEARDAAINFTLETAGTDYPKILDRGKKQLEKNVSRVAVFPSNVGIVRFQGTGDALVVRHGFLFRPPDVDEADLFTEHEIAMNLADPNAWPAELVLTSLTTLPLEVNPIGSVDVETLGGIPPYTFLWVNEANIPFSTEEDLVDAPAGIYTLTATDTNSRTAVLSPVVLIETS